MQSNKSDSNYVAVTRHRRYHLNSYVSSSSTIVNPNYLSSCPPILRVLHNQSYHQLNTTGTKKVSPNNNMMITRLDDDDIWFSSLSHNNNNSSSHRGNLSNYRTGTTTNQHDSDMNDHGNGTGMTGTGDGTNHPAIAGTTGNFDDHDDFSPDIVGGAGIASSSIQDDLTIVAPHSSITANVAYYERRRREDGWNDLGLDTIVSLRNNTTHSNHNHHHLSNVVPFDGSSSDDATTTTTQQQQQQQNTNND